MVVNEGGQAIVGNVTTGANAPANCGMHTAEMLASADELRGQRTRHA